jgi:outer membrane lipoprotein carrier protein
LVAACVSLAATGAQPSALDTARALQKRYDAVRDFTADFTHTYEGGVLKKKTVERGTVQIKKPGRMRWEYLSPDRKTFDSDGVRMYSYIPADKQVIESAVPDEDEATTAILFLTGKGNLTRDFQVSFTGAPSSDTVALRLDPRQKQRDYDWLTVVADKTTFQIRSLTAGDQQGGTSTFQFVNYKENTGIPDSVFTFKIPKGADVINAGRDR